MKLEMGASLALAALYETSNVECVACLPLPSPDTYSVASVNWRVTEQADFKLAATSGPVAIEI